MGCGLRVGGMRMVNKVQKTEEGGGKKVLNHYSNV